MQGHCYGYCYANAMCLEPAGCTQQVCSEAPVSFFWMLPPSLLCCVALSGCFWFISWAEVRVTWMKDLGNTKKAQYRSQRISPKLRHKFYSEFCLSVYFLSSCLVSTGTVCLPTAFTWAKDNLLQWPQAKASSCLDPFPRIME